MQVLVFGGSGQLGRELRKLAPHYAYPSRAEVDLSRPETLREKLRSISADLIVNTAAFTDVPRAEQERELAFRINSEAVEMIAKECATRQIPLIHFSTDFVFSGAGSRPWRESDPTEPPNQYAQSKRAGEIAIERNQPRSLILRTSWLYDSHSTNFFTKIVQLFQTKPEVRVVSDQVGAPTYAPHLARELQKLIEVWAKSQFEASGIFHVAHSGAASRFEIARFVLEHLKQRSFPLVTKSLMPCLTSDFPDPIKRPLNSRLDLTKLKQVFGIELPPWEVGMEECINDFCRRKQAS